MAADIVFFTEAGRVTGARLINFRNDSDEPLASHKFWIEEFLLKALAKSPGARLRMIGMASRNGSAAYNMGLSQRRINKVVAVINGRVPVVEKNPRGEIPATEDGVKDGDRSGFYRAVLIKW